MVEAKGVKSTVYSSCCCPSTLGPIWPGLCETAKATAKEMHSLARGNVHDGDVTDLLKELNGGFKKTI